MRERTHVVEARFDEADVTDVAALRDFARLTAQRLADRDRIRVVVGVKRTRRDFGALVAGLVGLMASSHATAIGEH